MTLSAATVEASISYLKLSGIVKSGTKYFINPLTMHVPPFSHGLKTQMLAGVSQDDPV